MVNAARSAILSAMPAVRTAKEVMYWSDCWRRAMANMPHKRGGTGRPRLLRTLLGYPHTPNRGHSLHVEACVRYGSKPRDPDRARLLETLAGLHGKTIVKVIAIQKDLDLTGYKF